jgi:hypothetical protein
MLQFRGMRHEFYAGRVIDDAQLGELDFDARAVVIERVANDILLSCSLSP